MISVLPNTTSSTNNPSNRNRIPCLTIFQNSAIITARSASVKWGLAPVYINPLPFMVMCCKFYRILGKSRKFLIISCKHLWGMTIKGKGANERTVCFTKIHHAGVGRVLGLVSLVSPNSLNSMNCDKFQKWDGYQRSSISSKRCIPRFKY